MAFNLFFTFRPLIQIIAPKLSKAIQTQSIHTIVGIIPTGPTAGGAWSLQTTRTKIRNYFPRPREVKRIKVHGWWKRMSTLPGRRILMRRILKGRHVLSH